MGGKFNGQKISEVRKDFVGPKSHQAGKQEVAPEVEQEAKKAPKRVKLKEGHVQLETPVKAEKNVFGGYDLPGGKGFIERKDVTIKNGEIVGVKAGGEKLFNQKAVSEVQPKSQKTIEKERAAAAAKAEEAARIKENAESVAFQLSFNRRLAGLPEAERNKVLAHANSIAGTEMSPKEKRDSINAMFSKAATAKS